MDNIVVGHLCQDPTLHQARRGDRPVARFTVAVNNWKRVGAEFVPRPPVFHRVICFGPLAENVSNSLTRGTEVVAVGQWVDDSYSDADGQRRVQLALEAKSVGAALRRATVSIHRNPRREPDGAPVAIEDPIDLTSTDATATDAALAPVAAVEPVDVGRATTSLELITGDPVPSPDRVMSRDQPRPRARSPRPATARAG